MEFGERDLPPISVLERPHTVFVARADTAERIGDATVRQMLRIRAARATFGMVWVAVEVVMIGFNGITGAVQAVFIIGISSLARPAVRRMRAKRFAANAAAFCGPGMTMAAQFGSEAMDIVDAQGHHRFRYEHLRAFITDRPDVIILHHGPILTGLPRELFPDWAIELIRAGMRGQFPAVPMDLPALPELPPVPRASAVFYATADTARLMAGVYVRPMIRIAMTGAAILIGGGFFLAVIMFSPLILVVSTVTGVILLGLALFTLTFGRRRIQAGLDAIMPPGQLLATRFGVHAFDIHTATGVVRHPYSRSAPCGSTAPPPCCRQGSSCRIHENCSPPT